MAYFEDEIAGRSTTLISLTHPCLEIPAYEALVERRQEVLHSTSKK